MEFNLKKSRIYKAVRFKKSFSPAFLKFWRVIFLLIGLVAGAAYIAGRDFSFRFRAVKIPGKLPETAEELVLERQEVFVNLPIQNWLYLAQDTWLGLMLIFISAGLFLLFFEIFYSFFLKYPKIKDENNLAELLDFDSANILEMAARTSRKLKESKASTDTILFAMANYKPAHGPLLRTGVDLKKLKEDLEKKFKSKWPSIYRLSLLPRNNKSPEGFIKFLDDANTLRQKHGHDRITMVDMLASLFDFNSDFKQLMIERDLDKGDLSSLAQWYEANLYHWEKRRRFWRLENLLRQPPIGTSWIYGYPKILASFTSDITKQFQDNKFDINLVGRDKVMKQIERSLARSGKTNILLIGESGVGKKQIVLGLAQKISRGQAVSSLNYKRVLQLDIALITSSSSEPTEVQNILSTVLTEASKIGNIILFIDGLHNFVGGIGGLGRSDVSGILLPYLESTTLQVITTSDPVSYHKHLATNTEIMNVFEKVSVEELPIDAVAHILGDAVIMAEAQKNIFFTYGAVKTILDDADKYIHTIPFPKKAIDLLSEVASYAKAQKISIVVAQNVHEVVTQHTKIPLGRISAEEKEQLINLRDDMHKEIIGQEEAVGAIARTMQRLRAGLTRRGKPAGVFLFVGPTGVGKTLTAKTLTKIYFGSAKKMIRFDMSEYQNQESLARLLGSIRLDEPGQLASAVRDAPFSVLLLDEFEKAHKDILNIFLQVFDEGRLTDVFGRKVNFEHTIIIATSNSGSSKIREMVKEGINPALQKEKLIDILVNEGQFRPELLNRFDEVVIFHPLSREHIKKIAEILLAKLVERLRDRGYFFKPNRDLIEYLTQVGFDPQFGARPMARAIQDRIETVIAQRILKGAIQKGDEFTLRVEEVK